MSCVSRRKKYIRPYQDSNLESSDSKSDALSITLQGLIYIITLNNVYTYNRFKIIFVSLITKILELLTRSFKMS
jgi:hypothetical protein